MEFIILTINQHKHWRELCLAHIKIYDRAIKIVSVGRPIYPVRLSQIGRCRVFTLKIFTADCSWEHFCFASVDHRPSIDRLSDDSRATFWDSGDHRPKIGRPITQKYIYVHAYYITMLTNYTGSSYLMHVTHYKYIDEWVD